MYGVTSLESPDAAKKSLQAAKEAYIAEKEKYRRLREERKKRKMNVSTDRYGALCVAFLVVAHTHPSSSCM